MMNNMFGGSSRPMQTQPQAMQPSAPIYSPVPTQPVMASPMSMPVHSSSSNIVINNSGGGGVGGGDGFAQRLFVDPWGIRGWSTDLCECLNDITSLACFFCCVPVMCCRVANRMNECAFIACCIPGGMTSMRVKVRTMGGIKGSMCNDCMVTCFCPCLAICQMQRELDVMGL